MTQGNRDVKALKVLAESKVQLAREETEERKEKG